MMVQSYELPEQLAALVGQEVAHWETELDASSIRGFARGLDYIDPVFFVRSAARTAGYADLPAPPGFLGTPAYVPGVSDPTFSLPFADLPIRPGSPAIAALPNVLNAGMSIEYDRQLIAGETLQVTEFIEALDIRRSAKLGVMLRCVLRIEYHDVDGALVATGRQTALYY
jgi:hypothetical protein